MGIAPLVALALLATRIDGGATASVSSQLGSPQIAGDTSSIEPALFVSGSLFLDVQSPLAGAVLTYSPRFAAGNDEGSQLFHQLSLAGDWRPAAEQTVRLSEGISFGDQDFSPLAPGNTGTIFMPPPIDRLPPQEVLQVLNSSSTLKYTLALSPFVALNLGGGFSIGGGLGSEARRELPLQRVSTFNGSFGWGLSKINTLALTLSGSLSTPQGAERAETLSGTFGWTHSFDHSTTGSLALGVAAIHNDGPVGTQETPIAPTGTATLTHGKLVAGRKATFSLSAGAIPAIDPLSGAGYLRASLTGTASWSPRDRLTLSLALSDAHGIGSGLQHDWGADATVSASLALPQGVQTSLGFRSAWLPPPEQPGTISGYQWSVFLSVSWGNSHAF